MTEQVLTRLDEAAGILTITLNRPESKNSVTEQAARLLKEAIADAEFDSKVRVVIVTGAGNSFCSGGNFKGFGAIDEGNSVAVRHSKEPLWNEIEYKSRRFFHGFEGPLLLHTMGKPTIALMRGAAVGAGVGLAASCDFRFVSESAYFLPGYIRVGISPDYGSSYYVTKLIGPSRARRMFFTGDKVDARRALDIGLVDEVFPEDRLEEETMAFARKLARQAPVALHYTKESINAAESQHLRDVLTLEARNFARTFQTEDAKEAVAAVMEKREPQFKGR